MKVVGAGLRGKGHDAARRVTELSLEAVGVHGELGDGLDGRRIVRDPRRLQRARGGRRDAVEGDAEASRPARPFGSVGNA